ncbi:processed acidic surface protein [Thermaerobacillus caldiproteolyticus]|uniref:processed acidic surface protein n=1 Tax=Thermaerobacillus caldiproteolyticus TaxID=247480 RepID=UPI0018F180EB|nr:processed acidic surface protein [Anoxybacillus caldiproteolyticus]
MKKLLFVAVICLFLNTINVDDRAFAQINEKELQQYVSSFGWTIEDLQHYLADYDMTINDFATLEKLKERLGTPITEENLNELLMRYNLTQEELEALLGQFGETVQDYTFIKDLDTAVDFYLHHDKEMQEINDMLASIGFTEQEVNRLFEHIMSLDERALVQQLEGVDARLEPFLHIDDPTKLTDAQQEELISIWETLLSALEIQPKFYLVKHGQKQKVSSRQLMAMNTLGGRDLLVELYNNQGERLVDLQLSENMLTSDYILHAGESFVHAGEMAAEMKEKMQGEKMPNTASPYVTNTLIGLLLMLLGAFVYWRTREKAME